MKFFSLLVLVCIVNIIKALKNGEPTLPTIWPEQFQMDFVTNITHTDKESNAVPIKATMWYDWTIKTQRIDHGGGGYECLNFYNSTLPCSLYMTPKGLYRVLSLPLPPNQDECCLDMDSIHASPPDWMISTNPTFNGQVTDVYTSEKAMHWSFPTPESNLQDDPKKLPHMYEEIASGEKYETTPLLFTFPVDNGRQDYHFDITSMKVGPIDSMLLQLPEGCAEKMCQTTRKV